MTEKNSGRTWADVVGQVPAKLVTWAFVILTGILSIFSGIAIFAWITNETLVLAGYEFGRASVGSGAVVAYDLTKCPNGWSSFKPATGRFLVGAGSEFDVSYEKDSSGNRLSARGRLQIGGAEAHKLDLAELPKHNHNLTTSLDGQAFQTGGKNYPVPTSANLQAYPFNGDEGEGKAHNNMPPYIALFFCKKD